jgi:hypothetical protein
MRLQPRFGQDTRALRYTAPTNVDPARRLDNRRDHCRFSLWLSFHRKRTANQIRLIFVATLVAFVFARRSYLFHSLTISRHQRNGVRLNSFPVMPSDAVICIGQTPSATVTLRVAKRSEQGAGAETAGLEVAKKAGAQVDVKTCGGVTCSTIIPPASLAPLETGLLVPPDKW